MSQRTTSAKLLFSFFSACGRGRNAATRWYLELWFWGLVPVTFGIACLPMLKLCLLLLDERLPNQSEQCPTQRNGLKAAQLMMWWASLYCSK
eukprot:6459638-Amphidinium_carterae.1